MKLKKWAHLDQAVAKVKADLTRLACIDIKLGDRNR